MRTSRIVVIHKNRNRPLDTGHWTPDKGQRNEKPAARAELMIRRNHASQSPRFGRTRTQRNPY